MKNLFYIFIFFISCSVSKNQNMNCEIASECFSNRETVQAHTMQVGEIKEVVKGHFAIVIKNGEQRFGPCNMNTKWCKEGTKVEFCGVEKVTLPNERRASTPFVLGKIEIVD